MKIGRIANPSLFLLSVLVLISGVADAQESNGCAHEQVAASPSRPTYSNGADVTQCGNVELEYGWTRAWLGAGTHGDDLGSSVRFGLTTFLDLQWNFDNLLTFHDGKSTHYSTGDHWFGFRMNFHRQTARTPSLAFSYSAKAPAADTVWGFGSGYVDHSFAFLASKDIRKYHVDFNAVDVAEGTAVAFEHSETFALACSRPLFGRVSGVAELYGGPLSGGDGFGSAFAALTYQVNPRLVLDGGMDFGVTQYAPRKRLLIGMTYAIADIYSHFRNRPNGSN